MKKNYTYSLMLFGALALTLNVFTSKAQNELVFTNPTYTGTAGAVGTVYKFANVTSGVDALVKASAKEEDFGHFVVQRSNDGVSYSDIAIVFGNNSGNGAGNAYTYTDNNKQGKLVYYRLNMVDKNGSSKYSPVKVIRNTDDKEASITTFPNPATSQLRVSIPNDWQNRQVTYSIYNISGEIISNKVCAQASQTETFNISDLKAGIYFIKTTAGGCSSVKRFVKAS